MEERWKKRRKRIIFGQMGHIPHGKQHEILKFRAAETFEFISNYVQNRSGSEKQ